MHESIYDVYLRCTEILQIHIYAKEAGGKRVCQNGNWALSTHYMIVMSPQQSLQLTRIYCELVIFKYIFKYYKEDLWY